MIQGEAGQRMLGNDEMRFRFAVSDESQLR